LCVCRCGCPVDCCLLFVFILVADPGRGGSLMLAGNTLVGLGCAAEGADAGGNRLVRGVLRSGQMPLRRCEPLAGCGWGRIVLAAGFQLVNPRADRVDALSEFLAAALPGLGFWFHASSMPAPGWEPGEKGRAEMSDCLLSGRACPGSSCTVQVTSGAADR